MSEKAVMIEIRGDIRDINAKLQGLQQNFKKTASETRRSTDSMAAGFSSLAGKIVGLAAGFVSIRSAIDIFKEFEKTAFTMRATFGNATEYMSQKAREMAQGTIYHTNEVSYAFTKTSDSMQRYGITGEKYMGLVQRAMDVGAAKGLELRESIDRIESAMRGEAEASEYLGVTLNDTYMKNNAFNGALKDQWEKLSDNEKAMYRYQELMNQTGKYTGKAAEATKELWGQAREFGNELKDNVYFWLDKTNTLLQQIGSEKNKTILQHLTDILRQSRDFWGEVLTGQRAVMLGNKQIAGPTGSLDLVSAHSGAWQKVNPSITPSSVPKSSGGAATARSYDRKKEMDSHVVAFKDYQAESEAMAEKYSREFEAAKNGLTDLENSLLTIEGPLSQMRDTFEKIGSGDFFNILSTRWKEMVGSAKSDVEVLANATAEAFSSLASGIGDAVANAVVHGEDLAQAMGALLKRVAADIISMLIEVQIQKMISHVIGKGAMMTATTAEATAGVMLSAIEAYKSTAAIPYFGPILAPVAAAQAMAFTMPLATSAIAAAAAYGEGGISWKPELALVGEKGPEAHIPLKGGAVPVDISGGGGNVYNITIAANDARSFADMVERNPGAIGVAVEKLMRSNSRLRHTLREYR